MFTGTLEAIFIGPTKGQPMQQVESIQAIAGAGLEGDRHSIGKGTFSRRAPSVSDGSATNATAADRQVTLIEAEAFEAAQRDYDLKIEPHQPRRNLLVRGVPLNHLVGREFQIGPVRLRGIKLCEPCGHLEKMTVPGIETSPPPPRRPPRRNPHLRRTPPRRLRVRNLSLRSASVRPSAQSSPKHPSASPSD